jgi:hypothetical protein
MFFLTPILSVALLAALTAAAPATLEERQGGAFVAVGVKYSGPGCNPAATPLGDPIFGNGNVCQPLDRFGTGAPIVSYQTASVSAGCSGKSSSSSCWSIRTRYFTRLWLTYATVTVYTGADCTGTAFSAPVGGCVTGNSPFISTFVTCK